MDKEEHDESASGEDEGEGMWSRLFLEHFETLNQDDIDSLTKNKNTITVPGSKDLINYNPQSLNPAREKYDALIKELDQKNALIETLQKENEELKENVKYQKFKYSEKEEELNQTQLSLKNIQESSKGQNAVIDQLKKRVEELEDDVPNKRNDRLSAHSFELGALDEHIPKPHSFRGNEDETLGGSSRQNDKSREEKPHNMMNLAAENNILKELIQKEQEARVKQFKDTMELEIRIKSFEDEVAKNQQERYQLVLDLDRLTNNQTKLFSEIKESEEILNTWVAFLEKNGLIQTSFLSEDAALFIND